MKLAVLSFASLCGLGAALPARAETYPPIPPSLTTPDRVVILRLYSPLEPFFDKSWRPSEIEKVSG